MCPKETLLDFTCACQNGHQQTRDKLGEHLDSSS